MDLDLKSNGSIYHHMETDREWDFINEYLYESLNDDDVAGTVQ